MSDDLVIRGGGRVAVATDELWSRLAAVVRLRRECDELRSLLGRADRWVSRGAILTVDAPSSALEADDAVDAALDSIRAVEEVSGRLALGLGVSAFGYGKAEHDAEALATTLFARGGYLAGALAPLAAVLMGQRLATTAGVGLGIAELLSPGVTSRTLEQIGTLLRENNELLSNPAAVALVRHLVMAADDTVAGARGVPAPLAYALGDEGLGVTGVAASSAMLVGVGGLLGALRERAGGVTAVPARPPATAPKTLAELGARLPASGPEQIRIERYHRPHGQDSFVVYLAGTIDFSPIAGTESWDMTSNAHASAQLSPASERATVEAMAAAGVTAETPVVLVGYSQGGLIAANIAASGDYTVGGLVTMGAPTGQIPVPEGVPAIALEHSDDIVPAFGGTRADQDVVTVQREVFAGEPVPSDVVFPAHDFARYRETAALADAAGAALLRDTIDAVAGATAGAEPAAATLYRAERDRVSGDR